MAAQWVWKNQHEVVCFCEQDKFCQEKILKKYWPDVPIVEDVRNVESIRRHVRTAINLLTGGFPCQPFSIAGKRRSKTDDRYLWPAMLEVIKATRPHWVIGENVTGIVNLALDTVLSDLENQGYACQAFIIPACAQNAPHRRDRVWIVAHCNGSGRKKCNSPPEPGHTGYPAWRSVTANVADSTQQLQHWSRNPRKIGRYEFTNQSQNRGRNSRNPQPRVGIPNDGFPGWLVRAWGTEEWERGIPRVTTGVKDRTNKLKALGNAIVPQVVMPIMEAIKQIEENETP